MSNNSSLKGYPLNGNEGVLAVSRLELVGDFTPHSWCHVIKTAKGRSAPYAIAMLSRLVSDHMPFQLDPFTYEASPGPKPAPGESFRVDYENLHEWLRISPRQARKELRLLELLGLLRLQVKGHGFYVELVWEQIIAISASPGAEVL